MSTAESASVKMPPGPELPAARRSLAAMASTWRRVVADGEPARARRPPP